MANLEHAVKHSKGIDIHCDGEVVFTKLTYENYIRCMQYSNTGKYILYCDSVDTVLLNADDKTIIKSLPLPKIQNAIFSPKDTYVVTWEPYVIYGRPKPGEAERKPNPNLRFWRCDTGENLLITSCGRDMIWQPQWTADESVCLRLVGSELMVIKDEKFDRNCFKKVFKNIGCFKVSPGEAPLVAFYQKDSGNEPGRCEIRRIDKDFSLLSQRTIFKSDKAVLKWNSKGNAVLCTAISEVDASNKNYYGEQSLYLVTLQSDSSMKVTLDKEGPIYNAEWNPQGNEFAVCYGFMPSRVTVFNMRGDKAWKIKDDHINEIYYNPFGNILVVCGFSNIAAGTMEFYDTTKKEMISHLERPNTTAFTWAPDGQHFINATCAPRMRQDNSYTISHYTGKQICNVAFETGHEVWGVQFKQATPSKQKVFTIEKGSTKIVPKKAGAVHVVDKLIDQGIISTASKSAYIPPHLRKKTAETATGDAPKAKGGLTQKGEKKRTTSSSSSNDAIKNENSKILFRLQKKVNDILAIKEKFDKGETLQDNQIVKLSKLDAVTEDLENFKLSIAA
uniref:Eukaryotic translation initiation factor 2A n=1 Tax=Rhabditophanes sp. KR3021 TaxID=114890 RepID=A0AC35TN40_9BILA